MSQNKHQNFAENLRNLRSAQGLSLSDFSKELDIPKSTLQSILDNGQTSLHTAICISEKLNVPLDTLINGIISPEQFKRLDGFFSQLEWYNNLPKEKQAEVREHLFALIRLLQE